MSDWTRWALVLSIIVGPTWLWLLHLSRVHDDLHRTKPTANKDSKEAGL